jgi:hypothetical protein
MHVSRLLRRAIDDLRRQLGEMDEPEDEALGTPQPRELENRA